MVWKVLFVLISLSVTVASFTYGFRLMSKHEAESRSTEESSGTGAFWTPEAMELQILTNLAEDGDAEAQYVVGSKYYDGDGVPENKSEALKWFQLAAVQGYTHAQYDLGRMYAAGDGVAADDVKAYGWWTMAAALGNPTAASNRRNLGAVMPEEQVTQAKAWASSCLKSNYKGCD